MTDNITDFPTPTDSKSVKVIVCRNCESHKFYFEVDDEGATTIRCTDCGDRLGTAFMYDKDDTEH